MNDNDLVLIRNVAKSIAAKWSLVDIDDIASELVVWYLENPKIAERYLDDDAKGKLIVALQRRGTAYAKKEQTIMQGGSLFDSGVYSVDRLKRLLPIFYEHQFRDFAHVAGAYAYGHDFVVAVATDLTRGLSKLSDHHVKTLEQRFSAGLTFEKIGLAEGITKRAAKKRVDRALDELSLKITHQH